MKKIFIVAVMICCLVGAGFGQQKEPRKYRKFSRMIADSENANRMFSGLTGVGSSSSLNSETTIFKRRHVSQCGCG